MSIATRFVSSTARPRLDLSGCVFYAPLWRPDLGGSPFTTIGDNGIPTHVCTVTGATYGIQGRTFDGVDDKIDLGLPAALDFGANSFSILLWFYYATSATDKPFFESTDAGSRRRISMRSSAVSREATVGGMIEAYPAGGAGTGIAAGWHHYVYVYDKDAGGGAGLTSGYIDAVFGASVAGAGTLATPTDNLLGRSTNINTWLTGVIGEVTIFNRGVVLLEIQQNRLATKWRYQ